MVVRANGRVLPLVMAKVCFQGRRLGCRSDVSTTRGWWEAPGSGQEEALCVQLSPRVSEGLCHSICKVWPQVPRLKQPFCRQPPAAVADFSH